MIKAGITGADSKAAGELIRILVNHPDVEIMSLSAPDSRGHKVAARHHGLIGELDMEFSDRQDLGKLDVVFICSEKEEAEQFLSLIEAAKYPDLRIIDMSGAAAGRDGFICGVSELFRKPMVRGAKTVFIPPAEASAALISLYPLAANLLLQGDIEIALSLPENVSAGLASGEIAAEAIRSVQNSFSGNINFSVSENPEEARGMKMRTVIPMQLSLPDVLDLYENIYDDHNFTFLTSRSVSSREAAGTHRCILTLSKPEAGKLQIEAVADAHLRGGAGDAVHCMNLLFGLHERTGLSLKTSAF